jgi:hypothetical protein
MSFKRTPTPSHPTGVTIEIVGIERGERGRSCEEHAVCGSAVLQEDTVVRICKCQILLDDGKEDTALAVYWVGDGIDRCRVGFLPRHLVKHVNDCIQREVGSGSRDVCWFGQPVKACIGKMQEVMDVVLLC